VKVEREAITFSFGKNWRDFVDTISEDSVRRARSDIEEWLGADGVSGKSIVDIGCGSGIHSLCFHLMGAKQLVSLDIDPYSVESTRLLWEKAGKPLGWKVCHGSVLDKDFLGGLNRSEVVYSWGVLHHTGAMWEAIDAASSLVAENGQFWIALYAKGPKYAEHLALKRAYNRASGLGKKLMVWKYIAEVMRERRRAGLNPFGWNEKRERGMDVYHDIVDWLGGLPYEVASRDEVVDFCGARGLVPDKIREVSEGGCSTYLFSRPA
jgi:2-polyprenyl-6-hydroxyphenyl methylase/3-demethylubiquinone-9 3-methyltransferase